MLLVTRAIMDVQSELLGPLRVIKRIDELAERSYSSWPRGYRTDK